MREVEGEKKSQPVIFFVYVLVLVVVRFYFGVLSPLRSLPSPHLSFDSLQFILFLPPSLSHPLPSNLDPYSSSFFH